jgi:hypothetical protein
MMNANDIARHNETITQLTAEDGHRRLTWEQHVAVFDGPVVDVLPPGQLVAAWDLAEVCTVEEYRPHIRQYAVRSPATKSAYLYPASKLRPVE